MKFRCERDVLVEALATAGRAVGSRGTLPGLSGVRAQLDGDQLRLTGSDLDLTITIVVTVTGERDGVVVIPARLASDIVKSLSAGAVSVTAEGDELLISSGRSQFSIRLIAGDDFPQIEPIQQPAVELSAPVLAEALRQVVPAASNDESRPPLTGVLVAAEGDGVRLVATDSYRLAKRDIPGVKVLGDDQQVLIPSRALSELNRILGSAERVELRLGEREASFTVGHVDLITRLIEAEFPNYRGLIPESHPNALTVSRDELLDALRRVRLLAREATPVRLEMTDGGVELAAVTQDVGTAREELEGQYSGTPLTVAFNPQYLLDGVEVASGESVILSTIDELKPAVISTSDAPDFLYLLMPVRTS